MSNQYITNTILARQAGGTARLSDADLKEITDREHHVETSIADKHRQLETVTAMEEWYRQNAQASATLEDTTRHHNEVNKQYLALRSEEMKLERFDAVQAFHPFYEQIAERRRVIDGLKVQEAEVAEAIEAARARQAEAGRQHSVAVERLAGTEEQLNKQQPVIDHGHILDGEIKTLTDDLIAAQERLDDAQRQLGESEADLRSRQNELANAGQQVENLSLHHQALAVHEQLFEQFHAVGDKLLLYNTEDKFNENIHQQFTTHNRRHSELLIVHDRTRKQLIAAQERLDALVADRKVHETAIDETDSATLYRRYAQQQQRLVQLETARHAWNTIATGYDAIEAHRAALERMTRQLDQKRQEQEVAERDVKRLFERYNRLNKAFTLLQIEQTRKLRESLKEGTPCPVCGSAHHPYHTEVEQELGETQTQLERDYLTALKDYEARQASAAEVIAETQSRAGRLEAERDVLQRLMERQHALETEWDRFRRLDSSFTICSPSVNRDARRTTIEMLIDSTQRHIEEYEGQIARFDFHTAQLHDITLRTRKEEETVEALREQFWKIDTELQLVHERLETSRTIMAESDTRIEHLYKDLDDVVTLSGWRDDNLERFSKMLGELYSDWTTTTATLEKRQHEYDLLRYKTDVAAATCDRKRRLVNTCREERDRLRELHNAKREELRKDFGAATPSEQANTLIAAIDEAQHNCDEAAKAYNDTDRALAALAGQREALAETRRLQEEHLRQLSTNLDHALARHNLTNSAVHTNELAAIFGDDRDWVLLRQTVTECRDALLVAQERMRIAERNFMTLQNDPARPAPNNEEDKPERLEQRHTALVLSLEALNGELADIRRILARHEAG